MTFTTPAFLILFVAVFCVYWRCERVGQNRTVLVASLIFYGWWDWRFLFLLLGVACLDFVVALKMNRATPAMRKLLLGISLFSNLGTLGFYKYFDFFARSLQAGLREAGVEVSPFTLNLVLPIGISFYTFQALSYTIDVYRRHLEPIRSLTTYLAFITFFPQLVAGPIERAKHMLGQFERTRIFDRADAIDGCRQVLWGLFKKMVIADSLAIIVSDAFADGSAGSGSLRLWGTLAFTFQIYCDFSAYSDIAIGSAKVLGIRLMRNFAYPYFARDIPEFWRRWHISLTTWFRDYLFIPLGGSRTGPLRRRINVAIVFLVSGLWHGANVTFIVWGALHAVGYFLIDFGSRGQDADDHRLWPGWTRLGQMLITFAFVSLAWVFFRAASMTQAWDVLRDIGHAVTHRAISLPPLRMTALVAILLGAEWVRRRYPHPLQALTIARPLRHALYYVLILVVLYLAPLGYTPFIYFQF